eukprot:842319-Lingulodinium_polyedra.AAC.1
MAWPWTSVAWEFRASTAASGSSPPSASACLPLCGARRTAPRASPRAPRPAPSAPPGAAGRARRRPA